MEWWPANEIWVFTLGWFHWCHGQNLEQRLRRIEKLRKSEQWHTIHGSGLYGAKMMTNWVFYNLNLYTHVSTFLTCLTWVIFNSCIHRFYKLHPWWAWLVKMSANKTKDWNLLFNCLHNYWLFNNNILIYNSQGELECHYLYFYFSVPVKCNTNIRLHHVSTKKNLHSHYFQSPLSGHQEVSCYGDEDGVGDTGDHWTVVCNNDFWRRDTPVKFRHVDTGAWVCFSM